MRTVENKHWAIHLDEEHDLVTIASKNHLIGTLYEKNEYSVIRIEIAEAHDLRDLLSLLLSMPERNLRQ